ncbi:MAG: cupin domain-containing protein [Steroidobacteraceae bacterium]
MPTRSLSRWLILLAVAFSLTCAAALASAAPPPHAGIHVLLTKNLPDIPGKQVLMLTLEYPPGRMPSPPHRHDADVFVYVLEGTFVTQVRGKKVETLHKGQWFYEGPHDIHEVSANGSATKPLKLLIFMVKDRNKPATMPVK